MSTPVAVDPDTSGVVEHKGVTGFASLCAGNFCGVQHLAVVIVDNEEFTAVGDRDGDFLLCHRENVSEIDLRGWHGKHFHCFRVGCRQVDSVERNSAGGNPQVASGGSHDVGITFDVPVGERFCGEFGKGLLARVET